MEKLQNMLVEYNRTHDGFGLGWHKQFVTVPFPRYWSRVYELLKNINREKRIVEIGSGFGDVLACCCYLGFGSVVGFEREREIGFLAARKMADMFGRDGSIVVDDFRLNPAICDVLIMVNCVYADAAMTKASYCQMLRSLVMMAGNPSIFIYEAVDGAFKMAHEAFPAHVRLCEEEIRETFPDRHVQGWQTHSIPQNRTDKRLYLLERSVP
jgi:protein-L-isoaspartate(D-aspartate) O-methyltransferase